MIAQIEATWPSASGALLVHAQLLLSWTVVQYAMPRGEKPALTLSFVDAGLMSGSALFLLGYHVLDAWILAITVGLAAVILPVVRPRVEKRRWAAEWEIGFTVLVVAITAALVARIDPSGPAVTLIRFGADSDAVASALVLLAAVIFLGRGGNIIVRGFLEKAGTLPTYREAKSPAELLWTGSARAAVLEQGVWHVEVRQGPDTTAGPASENQERAVDRIEIRRGRLIGTLERTLLLLLALGANYTAVAFLITAKGLVRAKEFERREYAEYFLIGTLASTALALILGTLMRYALGMPGA